MTTTTLVQVSFRARNDDVALNSATFTHALNANFSQAVDTAFRVEGTKSATLHGEFVLLPDTASLTAIFDAIRLT